MSDAFEFLQPKKGMTSIEAANQFLAEEKRQEAEQAKIFSMDELEKAALVRWLGFPFTMTVHVNRVLFVDRTTGLKTSCLYTEPMDMKVGKRMVRSLARLKTMHDKQQKANG
jgi:hypothetical protein